MYSDLNEQIQQGGVDTTEELKGLAGKATGIDVPPSERYPNRNRLDRYPNAIERKNGKQCNFFPYKIRYSNGQLNVRWRATY